MGNRCLVVFTDGERLSPATYLHWNGGADSIYQFLDAMDRLGVRGTDLSYCSARFVQLVTNFFDEPNDGEPFSGLSCGLVNVPQGETVEQRLKDIPHDSGMNGIYLVDRSGDSTTVRRFKCPYGDDSPDFVEKDQEWVRKEYERNKDHYEGMADDLVNLWKQSEKVKT